MQSLFMLTTIVVRVIYECQSLNYQRDAVIIWFSELSPIMCDETHSFWKDFHIKAAAIAAAYKLLSPASALCIDLAYDMQGEILMANVGTFSV